MNSAQHTEKLSEIADLNPSLAESLSSDEPVSFVPMSAVTAETASTSHGENRCYGEVSKGYTPFRDGDLLVAKITPCFENGKIAQATLTHRFGFGSTEFHVIRPKPGKADARYLLHFLRQDRIRRDGERKMTGSAGQRRVPGHFLAGLSVPLPPLPEQRRIAEILDKADALRAKRRAALAQLDTLTQSIFLDMFGDPATNPKGWPVRAFDEVMRDETSRAAKLQKSDYAATGQYPVVDQGQSVIAGYCDDERYLCPSDLPLVVFGDHTRAVKLVRQRFVVGADGAKVLVPHPGVDAVFLSYLLRALPIPDLGYSRHMRELKRLNFPIPPIDLQQAFSRQIDRIELCRRLHDRSCVELDFLFSSLQQRAFRGELATDDNSQTAFAGSISPC